MRTKTYIQGFKNSQKIRAENLNYIGNCTDDDVIEHIFGDATGFAQAVDEYGDEFTLDDLVVKYDPETDVHSFYYKEQGVAEGAPELLKKEMPLHRHAEKLLAQKDGALVPTGLGMTSYNTSQVGTQVQIDLI